MLHFAIVIDRTIGGGALGTSPGYGYRPPSPGEMAPGTNHVLEEVLTILHRQEGDTKKMINMLEEELSHMDVKTSAGSINCEQEATADPKETKLAKKCLMNRSKQILCLISRF